ncbi:sigma-54 dependent transcriptional regulator [Pseudomonas sp. F1_0610]|uniref:sigma-54-dependent transcriptional regulator n=1 Tax=Pseudomonas sp. F1_0610 TaxID=3114284 RepID=UPI0039C407DF
MPHILIVEDEQIIRLALKRLLVKHGYQVSEAGSVAQAQQFEASQFDLIITDLRLPGEPGTEILKTAGAVPVLIMTSYASLRSAVDIMKMGAVDYIAKPFEHDEMLQAIERIVNQKSLSAQAQPAEDVENDTGIIGKSPGMLALFNKIRKVAPTDSNVLIQGESGTGKELVAQALHKLSKRNQGPMICVNCAAIPETLIESELFGHEKGAFTGAVSARTGLVEAANGGTLFLDEIGELPLEAQARLLRVLQESEIRRVGSVQSQKVDVRLIAATHRDLKTLAQEGQFREDLYYRLNVIALKLPALREREGDIYEIAKVLLARRCKRMGIEPMQFTDSAKHALLNYPWPGNVRELENAIERAVILCDDAKITADLMGIEDSLEINQATESNAQQDASLQEYFTQYVLQHQDSMNETELAKNLGVSRKCLWERRQRFGITRPKKS